MNEPVKVIFKKLENGIEYASEGYYTDEADFKERNHTLFFVKMTNRTKPIPKKKETTD